MEGAAMDPMKPRRDAFILANGDLVARLKGCRADNVQAKSLMDDLAAFGALSDGQIKFAWVVIYRDDDRKRRTP